MYKPKRSESISAINLALCGEHLVTFVGSVKPASLKLSSWRILALVTMTISLGGEPFASCQNKEP